jgi:hypothetical protein
MDWTAFLHSLLSTQVPALPLLGVMRLYLALSWALVLAALGLWLLQRWMPQGKPVWRWAVPVGLVLWAVWPGPLSPTYWLGLAFQAPSLLSTVLCGMFVLRPLKPAVLPAERCEAPWYFSVAGVVLGWLLLLDTFAVWPVSLYALGSSPAALAVVALVACLPWLLAGPRQSARNASFLLGGVLLLQVLLRLPTGNLWDALLDPWLWIVLQLDWLQRGLRRFRGSQS